MRILLFIAILPFIFAAEIKNQECPDGTQCPFGKVCCPKPTYDSAKLPPYNCCDIPESERENKKLVPGIYSSYMSNFSAAVPTSGPDGVVQKAQCYGTWCSPTLCCQSYQLATCCANSRICCPYGHQCCSYYNTPIWCCPRSSRCAKTQGLCVAGAAALSPTITCLISLFLLLIGLKMSR